MAEQSLRRKGSSPKIIAAWDEHTPLILGMIAINDRCIGGEPPEWFFSSGDSRCKVRCALYVTAYFGADPNQVADTIDGIRAAGDEQAAVPFGHDFAYADRVVDYYRGVGGEPRGPGTGEPPGLSHAPTLTLLWDHVRTSAGPRHGLVEEPSLPGEHDPPVRRCLREPASASVAELRRRYGMVFCARIPSAELLHEVEVARVSGRPAAAMTRQRGEIVARLTAQA